MFERFTERARQAVVLAQSEARELRHDYIGTEHLLLGLLAVDDGAAARALASVAVTRDDVRAQVQRIVGAGDAPVAGQIPFTPRAKKALESALKEAVALRDHEIRTEHILLGVVKQKDGVAARILDDFGLDPERVRAAVGPFVGDVPAPAEARPREPMALESPPLAPEFLAALDRLRAEKEAALDAHDFERAALLRDRERRATMAAREVMRVWRDDLG